MCELLWSDPGPGNGRTPSKRGVGVAFGADVTQRFLKDNGLDLLVRSHEVLPFAWAPLRETLCGLWVSACEMMRGPPCMSLTSMRLHG